MSDGKRYFWLKLKDDFFTSKRIKKLRKLAGGDTYTIIYLKMQLLALKTDGVLTYTGLEKSFAEEVALDLDEEVDNVQVTLQFLSNCDLIESSDDIEYFLPYVLENTGSELAAAQRMRECRARKKITECNNVTSVLHERDGEIEIELEKEIEIERDKGKRTRFVKPTLDEVKDYIFEKGYKVDAEKWYAHYESNGWLVGKNKMKDWHSSLAYWNRTDNPNPKPKTANRFDSVAEWLSDCEGGDPCG